MSFTTIAVKLDGTQDTEFFMHRTLAVAWCANKCRSTTHKEAVVIENETGKAQKFINGRFYTESTND